MRFDSEAPIGYVRVSKSNGTQTLVPHRDAMLAAGVVTSEINGGKSPSLYGGHLLSEGSVNVWAGVSVSEDGCGGQKSSVVEQ
jgi:hypothetical protein